MTTTFNIDKHRNATVEAKQPADRDPQFIRVYCAGKIAKNDWRHDLFPHMRSASGSWVANETPEPDQPLYRGRFAYAGPFFRGCDHGCGHGRSSHGVGANDGSVCMANPSQARTVELCRKWIDDSDVMFVWLDAIDAYGTVAEIGYAVARGIPVWLFEPATMSDVQRTDMWFVRTMATRVTIAANPLDAFARFAAAHGLSAAGVGLAQVHLFRSSVEPSLFSFVTDRSSLPNLIGDGEIVHTIETPDAAAARLRFRAYFAKQRVGPEWYALSEMDVVMLKGIKKFDAK
ncbi:MAG TPA: hypothetical protein VGN72_14550 [Tepidisphaeraceae bacterium]|jgi:hypothetical protein|nr:hypothetical protein [Tepidisphaeraceae bacterium]